MTIFLFVAKKNNKNTKKIFYALWSKKTNNIKLKIQFLFKRIQCEFQMI